MIQSITFLGLYYLVGTLSLPPALAGLVVFIGKALDLIAYPAIGMLSDRTRGPWGRRRPYLLIGAIASGLAYGIDFGLPVYSTLTLCAIAAIASLSFYALALAIFFVPYMAQSTEIVADAAARNTIMGYRTVFRRRAVAGRHRALNLRLSRRARQ